MTNDRIEELCREITSEPEVDTLKQEKQCSVNKNVKPENNKATAPEEAQQKEKLSYKYTTFALTALVFVLLAFFLGLRYIEKRSLEEYSLPQDAYISSTSEYHIAEIAGNEQKININMADKNELMQINGIGEKRAQAIIDYRNEYGDFVTIEDILKIPGFGTNLFNSIKDSITV